MAANFTGPLKGAMQMSWLRELLLAVPISAGSARMAARDARRAIDDLARSPAFEATFDHTRAPLAVRHITVPVTVAFGGRDWILTKSARRPDALPAHARWIDKPGWGHVPMSADPAGVARLIREDTRASVNARLRPSLGLRTESSF
jgi:pimeloyl-ACP methyl ester carboxylesterase